MIYKYFKENYNKITFLLIFSLFIFINFIYFYLNIFSLINIHNYSFNELFINYQSGFIRRGLLGEIFWQFSELTSVNPKVFFSFIFFILYLLQIYFFFKISKKFLFIKAIFILVIFSPALLLFHIYDPNMYFIKDIFIKLSIILHGYFFLKSFNFVDQSKKYFNYLKFIIIPIIFFIILIHEYQVFFISLHFLISLGLVKNYNDFKKILKIYSFLLLPFILIILFFGDQAQFDYLSEILKKFDIEINPHLGGGIIKYIGAFYKWHFFYFSYRDFLNLFFSFILSILIFFTLFKYLLTREIININSIYQKNYLFYFIPSIIPVFLTTDHGRNISLIAIHLVVYFLTLRLNIKKMNTLKKEFNKKFLSKVLLFLFLFFYIFMWKLDQFAGFGLRGVPNDIFQSSLFAEIIKFIKFLYNFIDSNLINLPEIRL